MIIVLVCLLRLLLMEEPQRVYFKADLSFYQAFLEMRREVRFAFTINLLKAGLFAWMIAQTAISSRLVLNLAFIVLIEAVGAVVCLAVLFFTFKDVSIYLRLAEVTGHVVRDEPVVNLSSEQNCTSQRVYSAVGQTRLVEQVDGGSQKVLIKVAKTALNQARDQEQPSLARSWEFYWKWSFLVLVYSIFSLTTEDMPASLHWALLGYVLITSVNYLLGMICCLVCCLLPIICCVVCAWVCCCGGLKQATREIRVPSKEAELQDILNAGGSCSICFMAIQARQPIYVLPCSDKHLFHTGCLTQWARVKSSCPMCRAEIPMTGQSQHQASQQAPQQAPPQQEVAQQGEPMVEIEQNMEGAAGVGSFEEM